MNQGKDNTFTVDYLTRMIQIIDDVDSSEGTACLITLSTGKRIFSTGLDLQFMLKDAMNSFRLFQKLQLLMAKLLALSVPTMAVINGTCMAGGLFIAMCHDLRIK